MKTCRIDREMLVHLLDSVKAAVLRRDVSATPLVLTWDCLTATAMVRSQQVCLTASAPCVADERSVVTLEHDRLCQIAHALTGRTVTLIADEDNGRLRVESGGFKFAAQLSEVERPHAPSEDVHAPLVDAAAPSIAALMRATVYAMSDNEMQAVLNGVFLTCPTENHASAAATDGHRLARLVLEIPGIHRVLPQAGAIINRRGAAALLELSEKAGPAMLRVSVQFGNLVVTSDGDTPVTLHAALVEGKFPDVSQVIPKSHQREVRFAPALLKETLSRVRRIQRTDDLVRMDVNADGILLKCLDASTGEAVEQFDAPVTGDALSIGVNGAYLLDALEQVKGNEQASMKLEDNLSALHLTAGAHDCAIMPMRLS